MPKKAIIAIQTTSDVARIRTRNPKTSEAVLDNTIGILNGYTTGGKELIENTIVFNPREKNSTPRVLRVGY